VNLPVTQRELRFAVGHPEGLTSNSWRMWATDKGDVYLACRDSFTDAKVSLHTSGRWRVGFTTEAVKKRPALAGSSRNRAWNVWDEPPPVQPNVVRAFHLVFLTSELAVRPEQRATGIWKKPMVLIEPPPAGKMVLATLFITRDQPPLRHESEPSQCLAFLEIGNGRHAQLVAHGESEGDLPEWLALRMAETHAKAVAAGVRPTADTYAYFCAEKGDATRFIIGARVLRPNAAAAKEETG